MPTRLLLFVLCTLPLTTRADPGIFESHADIGVVLHPGGTDYNSAKDTYTLTGSGANMWGTTDAFHYVYKKSTGDLSLSAEISFISAGGDPHRKAALIIRQTLDPDSPY